MVEYKIIITQRAFSEISECVLFLNNVSNVAAKELREEIFSSIESLKYMPNAYANIEALKIGGINYKRMPIHHGRYSIIYKIEYDSVIICSIIDLRKNNIFSLID